MSILKKIIAACVLTSACVFAQNAMDAIDNANVNVVKESKNPSRSIIGVGVRAGFGYAEYTDVGDALEAGLDEPSGFNFDGGIMFRAEILPQLHFTPEVSFGYVSASTEDEGFDLVYKQYNLNVPVTLRAYIKDIFYGMAGVQFGFNLKYEADIDAGNNDKLSPPGMDDFVVDNPMKDSDVEQEPFSMGLVFGAGAWFYKGLTADVRVYLGLTDLYSQEEANLADMSGMKMWSLQFNLGYWFI
ncbi:MAG: PorT family protein [Fibrobacteraceae bacterium]|nr:PorT family protein [Fibrobacteraceae bacterium]